MHQLVLQFHLFFVGRFENYVLLSVHDIIALMLLFCCR